MTGKRGTPLERFERYYIPEPNSGCWLWLGSIHENSGYAQLAMPGGVPIRAHRLAYMLFKGKIPCGLDVRHTCDIRCCVNPDHLLVGTRKQNMDDARQRGRIAKGFKLPQTKLDEKHKRAIISDSREHRLVAADYKIHPTYVSILKTRSGIKTKRQLHTFVRGEKHGCAILTNKQAQQIRRFYLRGWLQQRIADKFGIGQQTVSRIVRNKAY